MISFPNLWRWNGFFICSK